MRIPQGSSNGYSPNSHSRSLTPLISSESNRRLVGALIRAVARVRGKKESRSNPADVFMVTVVRCLSNMLCQQSNERLDFVGLTQKKQRGQIVMGKSGLLLAGSVQRTSNESWFECWRCQWKCHVSIWWSVPHKIFLQRLLDQAQVAMALPDRYGIAQGILWDAEELLCVTFFVMLSRQFLCGRSECATARQNQSTIS